MHTVQAKTLLSAKNGMNIYRGCTHGCIYCDSRSECYGMDHAFEDVAVKENAIDLLTEALRRKRKPCMIGTGSMSDPYMPCEETWRLTRRALEVIEAYGCGATVITKSDRILRDMDIWERIARKTKAVVQMTLTTFDESLCRILEPYASPTKDRVAVLKECQKRGIPTVVWLCPILPYVNDTVENLDGLLGYCLDTGVKGIVNFGFGVTLRKGNREYFYQKLDEHFPGLKERYMRRYGDAYECASDFSPALWETFRTRLRGSGILTDPTEVFSYLSDFPVKESQISFFDT